jgi:hypothetical protein
MLVNNWLVVAMMMNVLHVHDHLVQLMMVDAIY